MKPWLLQCGVDLENWIGSFDNPVGSLKSDTFRTAISFFEVIHVREAHCNDDYLFMTPIDTILFVSFVRAALCICGIRYGLP